jgi:hypothetical protein
MRVLVGGSSGLVGTALCDSLLADKHEVVRLARVEKAGKGEIRWDPPAGILDAASCEGFDAVINLAGDNIAKGRWNVIKKQKMRSSRIDTTRTLSRVLAKLEKPPKVFLQASAIGYYGHRGAEELAESAHNGSSWLAELCKEWERETQPAAQKGIRVINLRIGVVLSKLGGALREMLLPFKLGAGSNLGDGKQYWSVIGLDDLIRVIRFAIESDKLSGPVNAVSHALTNDEFTRTLNDVLWRPTLAPAVPAFAARLMFGEMADELLLGSCRVTPTRLKEAGFTFSHATVKDALKAALA